MQNRPRLGTWDFRIESCIVRVGSRGWLRLHNVIGKIHCWERSSSELSICSERSRTIMDDTSAFLGLFHSGFDDKIKYIHSLSPQRSEIPLYTISVGGHHLHTSFKTISVSQNSRI